MLAANLKFINKKRKINKQAWGQIKTHEKQNYWNIKEQKPCLLVLKSFKINMS
jgi:hypothetical protein